MLLSYPHVRARFRRKLSRPLDLELTPSGIMPNEKSKTQKKIGAKKVKLFVIFAFFAATNHEGK